MRVDFRECAPRWGGPLAFPVDDFGVAVHEDRIPDFFFEGFELVGKPDVVLVGERDKIVATQLEPCFLEPFREGGPVSLVFRGADNLQGEPGAVHLQNLCGGVGGTVVHGDNHVCRSGLRHQGIKHLRKILFSVVGCKNDADFRHVLNIANNGLVCCDCGHPFLFYICILGMETALRGIRLKKFIREFLLFIPFQMSLGGRLFILAFFAPFIFSYLLTYSIAVIKNKEKKIDKKFLLVLASPFIMLIVVQIIKMNEAVNLKTIEAYSTEIFYTSTSYIHMNELWESLPHEYSLGYGLNCLGIGSSVYNHIKSVWDIEHNPASVCVPSMIPQAFLDFGKIGSLVFFFIVFYIIEDRAMACMKKLTTKNMLVIILLCQITYQTVSSSVFDGLRTFIVGYIALILFVQMTQLKAVKNPDYF